MPGLRPWSRRRHLVVWSSSGAAATGAAGYRRIGTRHGRVRWWLRTGALLAVIGMLRLGRIARARWEPVCLLAGAVLAVAGVMLPSVAAFFAGLLVLISTLLKGIASHPARTARSSRL